MSDFKTRPDNFPTVIKGLIVTNVLVWIFQLVMDRQGFGLTEKLGLYPINSSEFRPYQLVTHMFTHAAYDQFGRVVFFHIFFNMFTLWMFGRIVENLWGPKRFLNFYLLCGLGAAAAHLAIEYMTGNESMAVGASGAVMGVAVAFAYLFPNTPLFIMFIPIPIKAKWAMLGFVAYDLFSGISRVSGDNVAHFAHLGGAITGFIIVLIWNRTNRRRFY